jgi:basic amino acid/polyamine antiporter, APA family
MADELKRGFGYWTTLALVMGSVFGTTIFFGIPIAAQYSGVMVILSWIILSAIGIYIAAIFGELSATYPKAGGAYEFSKRAYGKLPSFLTAWVAWLVGSLSTVVIVIAAVNSLNIGANQFTQFLIGVALIVLLNVIAFLGVQASSFLLLLIAVVMVGLPLMLITKGLPLVQGDLFVPFFTHGFKDVLVATFFMAEAYFGWEAVTYLAEETKNPTKTIPKALVQATAITGVIGFFLMIVLFGIFPLDKLTSLSSPLLDLSGLLFHENATLFFSAGIFFTLIGTAAATIISTPRLLLSLARDKLFLGQFTQIHPRFKTPHNAIMFQTVVLVLLLLLGLANYTTLLSMLVPLAAIMYVALILAVPILRNKYPEVERPFKIPFSPAGPALASVFFLSIVVGWMLAVPGASQSLQLALSLIGIGIPLYLLVELYYDSQMITKTNDLLAYVSLFFQKITGFGRGTRKKILAFLGEDIKGKTVLEYGGGTGSLTLDLLKAVGPGGTVNSSHFSRNYAKITKKRVQVKKWETEQLLYGNSNVFHDPGQLKRIHPAMSYADAVISVGLLGYIQDIRKILNDLYTIMPIGGKICFVENVDFFHLLPNVEWLASNKHIERLFKQAGFSVRVTRVKGLLWNKVFIYGIKYKGTVPYI